MAALTGAALVSTNIWCYDALLANNAAFKAARTSNLGDITGIVGSKTVFQRFFPKKMVAGILPPATQTPKNDGTKIHV